MEEEEEGSPNQRLGFGKMDYGCKHYRRRCKIRAPCCNEVYSCRHCHNEEKSVLNTHEIVRHEVEKVICSVCDTEQLVAHICLNCGVCMGEYFCQVCKFYDDTEKGQFHCNDCGICRVGGRENFFHCQKCGSCYSVGLRDNHLCIENSTRQQCPICYEFLFDSLNGITVLKCGHTLHLECLHEMSKHSQYCCPICSKSVFDMTNVWKRIDEEIEATPLAERHRNRKSHPNDRNLKTDTVDGWDMLEVVVGRVLSTGDSQAGISAVASDVVGQSTRNFGQTRGVEDDDFEETLDMNIDGTPIQPRDAHNEDNRAFEATTGSQRKRPREDGSTSRGVPCTLDFTELTGKIDEISFTFQGIHNIMDQARVTKERERAEKAKERALRVGDPWEALREIPEIDNPTRYKVLRMLKERNEDRSFLRMTLEERKGWIHYNLSAEQPYYPAFDRN